MILGKASPFTEKVTVDGTTLYRARFSGFSESNDAANACKLLKKGGMNCFASEADPRPRPLRRRVCVCRRSVKRQTGSRVEYQRCRPSKTSLAWFTRAARYAVPPWSGWSFFISVRCALRTSSRLAPG